MSFSDWKKAMQADGNFPRNIGPGPKARYIVRNAKASRRSGQLDAAGYDRAIKWAYRVDHGAAWLEELGGK